MDFLSVLPLELLPCLSLRCGFGPQSLAWLFLKNNSNIEKTLRAAAQSEARWLHAQRKREKAPKAPEASRYSSPSLRSGKLSKAQRIAEALLS